MHESAHNMGAVQYDAPNSTGSGIHCNESYDVVCYTPDGGDRNQGATAYRCPGRARFDCNFDDYFDAAPEPGEYLESHWNLGSPLNSFLNFEGTQAPTQPYAALASLQKLPGNGKKIAGAAGKPGDWQRYSVRVPGNAERLRVALEVGEGANLALYVRRQLAPTKQRFDCRQRAVRSNAECDRKDPPGGRWIVGVLTRGGEAGTPYTLRAKVRRTSPR